ncbi:hypothetical protein HPB51_007158 [Rhipicephalus microplus]|uniref:Uncharacterized protein n=1 Tax=Rhipicephalus microplus TaxID=6941 RepID=A0A9J6E0R7_RHIMP|nr:hypothetical protein HPB51_007158 [Rhipicephalus microplus]
MPVRRDVLRKQAREGICYGVWVTAGTALGLGLLQAQRWGSRGALFGAWIGAVALVLDWDRPWQQWPTPCVVGSLLFRGPALMAAGCIMASQ